MEKERAMTIFYAVGDNLYVNITNHCPCACVFCIRTQSNGAYGSEPLWLEHEPSQSEIDQAIRKQDLTQYREVVFCGFGEPTQRMRTLVTTADHLRAAGAKSIRLNTNGLSDITYGYPTAPILQGHIDTVSISLNAGTKEKYLEVTRPRYGEQSYEALQKFALDCKACIPHVMLTVVDVLEPEELEAARNMAENLGIPLRVRAYDGPDTRR